MKIKMTELRPGDKILVPATVTKRKTNDGSVIVQHESRNEFLIYRDCDIAEVTELAVKEGDCIDYQSRNGGEYWGVVGPKVGDFQTVWRYNERDTAPDFIRSVYARKPLPEGYEWPRKVPT